MHCTVALTERGGGGPDQDKVDQSVVHQWQSVSCHTVAGGEQRGSLGHGIMLTTQQTLQVSATDSNKLGNMRDNSLVLNVILACDCMYFFFIFFLLYFLK